MLFATFLGGASATSLFILPYTMNSLAAGDTLPQTLPNDTGKSVPLPTAGRSLLWIESSESASAVIKNPPSIVTDNLKSTLPLGRNTVIFIPLDNAPLPSRSQRLTVGARYKGAQVFYDERDAIRAPGDNVTSRLNGLYLVNDSNIVCRFLGLDNSSWEAQKVRSAILNSAAAFTKTGQVTACPEPARVPGAKVNTTGLPGTGKVRLFLRVTGDEADAPMNSVTYTTEATPEGGTQERQQLTHPASERRSRIDALTPLVKQAGAVPIALVMSGTANLNKLKKTFPDWTFILATPENSLRWLELNGVVLAPDGTVRLTFLAFGSAEESGVDALRAALGKK